jgi:uncharacterized flavoprotein (TIGR03862 family)
MQAKRKVAIIGGGPAGLMAAETLIAAANELNLQVDLYDAMPSVGRKFLLAGKGGMNLTHSEPADAFLQRYRQRQDQLAPALADFGADQLRAWADGLGIATFVGSSGRVFPVDMKAAPLLRAWLHRLRSAGVQFHMRHRWLGWQDQHLRFATIDGEQLIEADAVVLALGGGSWARLGSDGSWVPVLSERGVAVSPLQPSNCGFDVAWSDYFRQRFAGKPITAVAASVYSDPDASTPRQGQFVITDGGIEGSLIYALSAPLRDQIVQSGSAFLLLDLAPGKSAERIAQEVSHPRGSRSLSSHLQSKVGLDSLKTALLHECLTREELNDPFKLAQAIKALSLNVIRPRPIDEAISSAGGVCFSALESDLRLKAMPQVFCAGEMLDWEAPTGGYLLTACFSTGYRVGRGVLKMLGEYR